MIIVIMIKMMMILIKIIMIIINIIIMIIMIIIIPCWYSHQYSTNTRRAGIRSGVDLTDVNLDC